MAKYRKRPVVVEATQWKGGKSSSSCPGVMNIALIGSGEFKPGVRTVHDEITPIDIGDWVILESEKTHYTCPLAYPCKPDIFEATYEEVIDE